jgi:hypothetical protein
MDIRDRVMGDMPEDWLHRIAGIVPGYSGYVDRERRRDADKLLRTHLARLYSAQRDRLNRVQQSLVRARNINDIEDIDRLAGILQRFIDRLNNATYGYAGLFAPVKVEAEELDQLYAFDMALAGGVEQVESAVDAIESAATGSETGASDLPASITRLATLLDELNERLNQRADLITTGQGLPESQYGDLVNSLNRPQGSAYTGTGTSSPSTGSYTGQQSGEAARYPGGTSTSQPAETPRYPATGSSAGAPTTYTGTGGQGQTGTGTPTADLSPSSTMPPPPGVSNMSEGNQGFTEQPSGATMGDRSSGEVPRGGAAGTGIETSSSPASAAAPGAPGHDVVGGASLANTMDQPGDITDVPGTKVPETPPDMGDRGKTT